MPPGYRLLTQPHTIPYLYLKNTTMDSRQTLPPNGSFQNILEALFHQKQQAAILYEENGVTRANGIITSLYEKNGKQWMQLDAKEGMIDISIDQLYAVNGTFTSDYSEC